METLRARIKREIAETGRSDIASIPDLNERQCEEAQAIGVAATAAAVRVEDD